MNLACVRVASESAWMCIDFKPNHFLVFAVYTSPETHHTTACSKRGTTEHALVDPTRGPRTSCLYIVPSLVVFRIGRESCVARHSLCRYVLIHETMLRVSSRCGAGPDASEGVAWKETDWLPRGRSGWRKGGYAHSPWPGCTWSLFCWRGTSWSKP